MAWEPDRRSNFFFSPPAHLCAVTYMTEISLIVTLNNQFNSTQRNYGGWFVSFRYFVIAWRRRKDEGEKTQNCVFSTSPRNKGLRSEITKRQKTQTCIFSSFRLCHKITKRRKFSSFRYFVAKSKSARYFVAKSKRCKFASFRYFVAKSKRRKFAFFRYFVAKSKRRNFASFRYFGAKSKRRKIASFRYFVAKSKRRKDAILRLFAVVFSRFPYWNGTNQLP